MFVYIDYFLVCLHYLFKYPSGEKIFSVNLNYIEKMFSKLRPRELFTIMLVFRFWILVGITSTINIRIEKVNI